MDSVNLVASNAGSFVFSRVLTPWADLYDLAGGSFRAQMRRSATDHLVLYEWSSANGRISYAQTKANGAIAFAGNPANGDSITLGASAVTFVGSSPTGNQIAIGGSLAATLTALNTFLNAETDADISKCSYAIVGATLAISVKSAGTLGNSFALAASVAIPSGPTLSGAGSLITLTAPIADLAGFAGDYVYDCRFEMNADRIPLFGGAITFTSGVTRDG